MLPHREQIVKSMISYYKEKNYINQLKLKIRTHNLIINDYFILLQNDNLEEFVKKLHLSNIDYHQRYVKDLIKELSLYSI